MPLVSDPNHIRLGIAGMVEENGHPYSWSAILNGFDAGEMSKTAYPMIYYYLTAQPKSDFGIPGVHVTHVWCDDRKDAEHLAKASLIPHVVGRPEDMIGKVDAVLIPTDKGYEHVERARPFIDAGLPVYIDKPLADREDHLQQFIRWHGEGKAILSTSMMRYCREFADCRARMHELGGLRLVVLTIAKSWERYGIHALEGVYPLLEPGGWVSVVNTGTPAANIVHVRHASGADVLIPAIDDMFGGFGCLTLHGKTGSLSARFTDASRFYAFKQQLLGFVDYLRSGVSPVPFAHIVEIMKIVIAGIRSREEGGRRVMLSEICS
ncbi:MAG: oxidoreductase [Planctomycetes bacterium]|nr:oxidoreductase [Planctomycetota bacterium]